MPDECADRRTADVDGMPRVKPTVADLPVELTELDWQRSGTGPGSLEIAFVRADVGAAQGQVGDIWVLLRVAGDPAERVLVYDRTEWECFLDGVSRGEFDDAE